MFLIFCCPVKHCHTGSSHTIKSWTGRTSFHDTSSTDNLEEDWGTAWTVSTGVYCWTIDGDANSSFQISLTGTYYDHSLVRADPIDWIVAHIETSVTVSSERVESIASGADIVTCSVEKLPQATNMALYDVGSMQISHKAMNTALKHLMDVPVDGRIRALVRLSRISDDLVSIIISVPRSSIERTLGNGNYMWETPLSERRTIYRNIIGCW